MGQYPGQLSDRKDEDEVEEQFQGRYPLNLVWVGFGLTHGGKFAVSGRQRWVEFS
jgi:hypothetical protein